MKKVILFLLVVTIAISLVATFSLSGCKVEEAVEEATEEVEEAVEEATEEVEEAVEEELSGTIHLWSYPPQGDWYVNDLFPKFKEMYPNAEIEYTIIDYPEAHTKLLSGFAAGAVDSLPDVMMVYAPLFNGYVGQGMLYDITDWMEPLKDDFPSGYTNFLEVDGRTYGLGVYASGAVMFYKKSIFDASGIDPDSIETWNDWFEAGKKIYNDTGGKVKLTCTSPGGAMDWAQERLGLTIMEQRGTDFYDGNNNVIFDSPENAEKNKEILEFLKEVLDSDVTLEEAYWSPANYSAIENGEIATFPQGLWMGSAALQFYDPDSTDWRVMLLPAWEAGGTRYAEAGGNSSLAINSLSEVPELAFEFIKFIEANKENMLTEYSNIGNFPVYKPALEDPVFSEPNPYYGDQKVGDIFKEVTLNSEALHFGPNWPEATESLVSVSQNYLNGVISLDEAIAQIAEGLDVESQ